MGRRKAAGRYRFRGTVALPNLHRGMMIVKELIKLLFQLDAEGIPAGKNPFQATEIRFFHVRQTDQSFIKGGNTGNEIAAVFRNQLGIALCRKSRHKNAAASGGKHGMNTYP